MINLAGINSRVRALLDDNTGQRFPDALIAAALGQALEELARRMPRIQTAEHEITNAGRDQPLPAQAGCRFLIKVGVILEDGSLRELEPEAGFTYILEDGIPTLHFLGNRVPVVGERLRVCYAAGYAIEGYNAESTTLPVELETALISAAAAQACLLRAGSLLEMYGGRGDESERWLKLAVEWTAEFDRSVSALKMLQEFDFPPGFSLDRWDGERR